MESLFSSGEKLLEFFHTVERLKLLQRAGWKKPGRDIQDPESVSDHSYRMIIMAMMSKGVNREKLMCLAAVHDLGESIVGDIAPSDGISKEEKYIREELAFNYLRCLLVAENPSFANEIVALWKEFEEAKTPEAQRARELDAFECILQADEYEERSRGKKNLDNFLGLKSRISSPEVRQYLDLMLQAKEARRTREHLKPYSKILIIFVLGGPGGGKGTQCALLARDLGFQHISVGQLLRQEAERPESEFKDFISESFKHTITIPPWLTTVLLRKEMDKAVAEGKNKLLIDGYPRSVEQAEMFEEKVQERNFSLMLKCSEEIMRERLKRRAESSYRVDDNPEVIMNRIRTFHGENLLVEQHLRRNGRVETIECSGSVNQVYALVKPVVENMIRQMENSY